MAEGLNLILGKPTSIPDVKLPEISNPGTTDFSQDSIGDALNKYHNLSITEKDSIWEEVNKEV